MPSAGTAYINFQGNFSAVNQALASQFSKSRMGRLGKVAAAGFAAGFAGIAISTKMAIDFEKGMRNVNSIAQLSEKQFKKLNDQVLALAGPTAQSPQTLSEGLYDLVSSGFDANEAIGVLRKSSIAASAGLTDTATSTKAVAAALNAYRLDADKAGFVSDVMFKTVDRGVVSFEELSGSIGMVLPSAAALGVTLPEVGASISTLTKEGQSGASAVTNLNAAITAIFKPSEAMKEALDATGFASADAIIKAEGFQGALEELIGATDGSKEAIGELFPNVRALRAVFGLTGKNTKSATEDLKSFKDVAGATATAWKEQQKSFAVQWQRLVAQLQVGAIKLGQKVVPILSDLLKGIKKAFDKDGAVGVIDYLADQLAKAAPDIALAGLKIGGAIIKGIGQAFLETNLLGKLFIAGGAIWLFGGKAALFTVGTTIAKAIGAGIASTSVWQSISWAASTRVMAIGMSTSLVTAMKFALPVAIAGAGLVNIISSAMASDWRDAGFKAGGALVGGIAGFMAGGPIGALIGAGVGSFGGGFIEDLLFGDTTKETVKEKIDRLTGAVAKGFNAQMRAGDRLAASNKRVKRTQESAADASKRLERAEKHLNRVRQETPGDSRAIARAEERVADARADSRIEAARARRAEKLHGQERMAYKRITRSTYLEERELINTLKKQRDRQLKARDAALRSHAPAEELEKIQGKLDKTEKKLTETQKKHSKTVMDATNKVGPKFAKSLKYLTSAEKELGTAGKRTLDDFIDPFNTRSGPKAQQVLKNLGRSSKDAKSDVTGSMNTMGGSFFDFATTVYQGESNIASNTDKSLNMFGADPLDFSLKKPKKPVHRQTGGAIVPGFGAGDKVPVHVAGRLVAMTEPGEYVSVANRRATQAIMAANGTFPRFLKTGGMAAMISMANAWDRSDEPYQWGGGHGGFATPPTAVDCSGAVSGILHAGGLLDGAPMTSGSLMGWGKPAKGNENLVVYANPHHTVMSLNGRSFGTSPSNTNGGAGWIGAPGSSLAPGVMRTMPVAGGVAAKIAREILLGPNTPIKPGGQGALDMDRRAANKFISRHMPRGSLGGGDAQVGGGVLSMGELTTLVKAHRGPKIFPYVAYAESGGDPNAGNGSYEGLFALGSPFWSEYAPAGSGSWAQRVHDANTNTAVAVAGYNSAGLGPWADSQWKGGGGGWGQHMGDPWPKALGGLVGTRGAGLMGVGGLGRIFRSNKGGVLKLQKGSGGGRKKKLAAQSPVYKNAFHMTQQALRWRDRINRWTSEQGQIARLDEMIQVAQTRASSPIGPGGEDVTVEETGHQRQLLNRLLTRLKAVNTFAHKGLRLTQKAQKLPIDPTKKFSDLAYPGGKKYKTPILSKFRELERYFRDQKIMASGLTGSGGRIFDTKIALGDLRPTGSGSPSSGIDISQFLSVIEAARYGVFDKQLPKFHNEGVFRAPPGRREGLAVLSDGEKVTKGGDQYVAEIDLGNGVKQVVDLEFKKRSGESRTRSRQHRRVA